MTKTHKKVSIKLVKSLIGRKPKHIVTAKTLGLNKLNSSVEHNLTPAIEGMVNSISYLLQVKQVKEV
jgi:large subunit ribosomal protein L30